MADDVFEVELPLVDSGTPMRVALQKVNTAKKAGVIVVDELILVGVLIKGLRLGPQKSMGWLVDHLSEERRLQGKGPHWHGKEIVDYFQPRLDRYAAVFGLSGEGIPSGPLAVPALMDNGRFYRVASYAPGGGQATVQTHHAWIVRALAITMATCSCSAGCGSYDTADVSDGDPCPTQDGGKITCK